MARPRKIDTDRRDDAIPPVRLTGDERLHVEAQAAAAGLTVSDYARRRLLGHTVAPSRAAVDDRALIELNRVGVLLNQIARALNSDRPERIELADALADFRRVAAVLVAHGS